MVDPHRVHIDVGVRSRVFGVILSETESSVALAIRLRVNEVLEGFRDGADPGVRDDVPRKRLAGRRIHQLCSGRVCAPAARVISGAYRRKIASTEGVGRHRSVDPIARAKAQAAVRKKVKRLVAAVIKMGNVNRPAAGDVKRIVAEERRFRSVEKRPGGSDCIKVPPKQTAVQGVLTGLGHHLDLGYLPVFRRGIRRDDLGFLERFDRRRDTVRGPAAIGLVVDGCAVGRQVKGPASRSINDDVAAAHGVIAGGNDQDVGISPAEDAERQFDEISRRLDIGKSGRLGFDLAGPAAHRDGTGDGSHLQGCVDTFDLAHVEVDVGADVRLEALCRDADLVHASLETGNAVIPAFVRRQAPFDARALVLDSNRGSGYRPS